jgi:hypothetical protein
MGGKAMKAKIQRLANGEITFPKNRSKHVVNFLLTAFVAFAWKTYAVYTLSEKIHQIHS